MSRDRRQRRRGMALLLVVTVLALATALGYVMLSSASLQTRASANQSRLASADYLAESGLNLAMYFLQYPANAPGYSNNFSNVGYWTGTGGDVAICGAVPGTVNVTVTRDAADPWTYEIVSVAKPAGVSDTAITRTTGARVYVRNAYQITEAVRSNFQTIFYQYTTVVGDMWCNQKVQLKSFATNSPAISGRVYCLAPLTPTLTPGKGWGTLMFPLNGGYTTASGNNDLNLYKTYSIDDVTYSADSISTASLGAVTTNPTATNPAGVLYYNGAFQIDANATINGTLVVEGDLTIKQGVTVTINPQPGYPAMIVAGNMTIEQSKVRATLNGVCYIQKQFRSANALPASAIDYSRLTINGALLLGNTLAAPIPSSNNITVNLTYDATKAWAPELTSVQHQPRGISIVRWGLP